ncbi:MAG TPA: hypothetical protein PLB01_18340 [Thermoanaerobaculia bacterium]|jgi:hypothetical protein|nr:hypothetical protein [Thermoanaerobaculia bacterium]
MNDPRAILLSLSSLALLACSTVSIESQVHSTPAPAFSRTLVVVALPDAVRRPAEDALVARLASLHARTSYEHVPLAPGVTLGALREAARRDGFDGLLVVWPADMTSKTYPSLGNNSNFPVTNSLQVGMRLVASLTSLGDDREIWKGVVTNRDAAPLVKGTPKMAASLADRLVSDGVAN